MKIYFDMDGVLANFNKGVEDFCHIIPPNQNKGEKSSEMWKKLKDVPHFYDKLEMIPGAKDMFDSISKIADVEILTGIPKPNRELKTAAEDKKHGPEE